MSQLSSSEWRRVQECFFSLLDAPVDQHAALIEAAGLDADLQAEVRALWAANTSSGPLDLGLDPLLPRHAPAPSLPSGSVVADWRIERLLGRGGMGEVYLAHRMNREFQQTAALKLLRADSVSREAWLQSERRLLATLDHPGIARLIDGGMSEDGRPFMAMAYIEGQTLTQWCAQQSPSLQARLNVFLALCDAVSYAHGRLVIHRDLKPGNVLIDAEARPHLLDFGIARLLDDAVYEQTTTVWPLTPSYAAPEQLRGETQTTATDIFGLGGLLYFLLTQSSPWQSEGTALPVTLRRALQGDITAPSRVGASALPFSERELRGDLDAIVLKAMRPDPTQRYASAADLATDVRRHLNREPVHARSGSRGYLLRRFVRRHRLPLVAASSVLLLSIGSTVVIGWQAQRLAAERDIARAQTAKAEAMSQAVLTMFRNISELGQGDKTRAGDLLADNARRVIDGYDGTDPQAAAMVIALTHLYLQLDDVSSARHLVEQAQARGIGSDDPQAQAQLQLAMGLILGASGDSAAALAALDASDQTWSAEPRRYWRERLESHAARAQLLRLGGQREAAIQQLQADLPEAESYYALEPRELVLRYANLATHLLESNRLQEAADMLERAQRLLTRHRFLQTSAAGLAILQLRASWQSRTGAPEEAEQSLVDLVQTRRRLQGDSAGLGMDLLNLGKVQMTLQRDSAVASLLEAERLLTSFLGGQSVPALVSSTLLCEALIQQGELDRASPRMAELRDTMQSQPDPLLRGLYQRAHARLMLASGDRERAAASLTQATELFQSAGDGGVVYLKSLQTLRDQLEAH